MGMSLKYLYIKNTQRLNFETYGVVVSTLYEYEFFVILNKLKELI